MRPRSLLSLFLAACAFATVLCFCWTRLHLQQTPYDEPNTQEQQQMRYDELNSRDLNKNHRKATLRNVSLKLVLDEDCRRILEGDKDAILAAVNASMLQELPHDFVTDEQFATHSCDQLLQDFWTRGVSELETRFPIAFSILVHKDFYQLRLLLQALHRSHNSYCIHVDSKASRHLKTTVRRLAECLGNVRVTESNVEWGNFSLLEAHVLCFRELLHNNRRWKYVINLTGQEFPIRTLKEMTQILILMNGSNHVQRIRSDTPRYPVQYPAINDTRLSGLRWYKGSLFAVFSRPAVQYMLQDERAKIIYEHIRRTFVQAVNQTYPDETYFATLNHNYDILGFPGSYTGSEFHTDEEFLENQFFRYVLWEDQDGCPSELGVNEVCILGVADLQHVNAAPHLIANKFYSSHESEALRCFRDRFWANTEADYRSDVYRKTAELPVQFYRSLGFVQHHA